jgi:hypothetical protein
MTKEEGKPLFEGTGHGTAKNYGWLSDYYQAFRKPKLIAQNNLKFGDIITFTYKAKLAPEEGTRLRWAFVLHPNWQGKMHALELTAISPQDAMKKFIPKMKEEQDPYKWYHDVPDVKELVKHRDCYRTYLVDRMSTVLRYS